MFGFKLFNLETCEMVPRVRRNLPMRDFGVKSMLFDEHLAARRVYSFRNTESLEGTASPAYLVCTMMPIRALLVLLALWFSPRVSAIGGDRSVREARIAEGDRAYRTLDNARAFEAYLEAERLAPEDFGVLIRLTRITNDMGRLLLRKSPDAEAYYRKSITYAERLREHHPDRAETWFWLALCHGSLVPFKSLGEKLELSRDVRANAEHALAIDSNFTMSYVILGIYYRGVARLGWIERTFVNGILGKNLEGTFDDSERMLVRAKNLEPDNPFVCYELSSTYRAMDRTPEAIGELQHLLAIPPTNAREVQQIEEAREALRRLTNAGSK
jgi:tetratricopeptide (TPR) repeat protein